MTDYSMKDIHFVYKVNGEVEEKVFTFVNCWLSRVITEQTIVENIKYFINLIFSTNKIHILEDSILEDSFNFYSPTYTKRYLRYISKFYSSMLIDEKAYMECSNKLKHYYTAPYEIVRIYLTNSKNIIPIHQEKEIFVSVNNNFVPIEKEIEKEMETTNVKNTEYIIELALHLIKEFEGKRKEKLISCDEWVYLKQAVKNYYEEEV